MGPGFGTYSGCFGGIGGGFGMMFFGIIIIGAVIYFVMKGQNNNRGTFNSGISNNDTEANALDIAKSRLAKGEITSEEYENIKKTLI